VTEVSPRAPTSRHRQSPGRTLSRAEQIYRELRGHLLTGAFPYGDRLVEEQLAARFGCSRTPVREALRRLEGDGHVIADRSGGMRPNPPRVSTMHELYEVRIVLEALSTSSAAARGDRTALEELREHWTQLGDVSEPPSPEQRPDFVLHDESFHEELAEAGGNGELARHLRDINERIRVVRLHDFTTLDRITATVGEHLEVVDAVLAGDADGASALMRVHVQRSARVVEERVTALLARMFEVDAP
jgi:DNA-binding GntR family transcriptional regulator